MVLSCNLIDLSRAKKFVISERNLKVRKIKIIDCLFS